jgi:hypothetical protein
MWGNIYLILVDNDLALCYCGRSDINMWIFDAYPFSDIRDVLDMVRYQIFVTKLSLMLKCWFFICVELPYMLLSLSYLILIYNHCVYLILLMGIHLLNIIDN